MKRNIYAWLALALVLVASILFLMIERAALVIRFLPLILILALLITALGLFLAFRSFRREARGDDTWVKVKTAPRRKDPPSS